MIAIVLNIIILGILISSLMKGAKGKPLEKHLFPALAFKILCGIGLGLLYRHYYSPDGDTYFLFNQASFLADIFMDSPTDYFRIFFFNELNETAYHFFQTWNQPRAFFFVKMISIINILTNNNYWITSIYFSIFSFAGAFYLANYLQEKFQIRKGVLSLAFFYFPSYVFWSSGIIKESVAAGCICFTIFLALKCTEYKRWIPLLLPLALCLYIIWNVKFYYAAVLFPLLGIYVLYELLKTKISRLLFSLIAAGSAGGMLLIFSLLTYNLQFSYFPEALYNNYLATINLSQTPDLTFIHFKPTWTGIYRCFPEGVVTGLFRPFIWESEQNIQILAGLENIGVLVLASTSLLYMLYSRRLKLSFEANLVFVYVILLAGLLALASPNFGSLVRYRIGFYPFFIILITSRNPVFEFITSSFKVTSVKKNIRPESV